jgi:hypothetical protein
MKRPPEITIKIYLAFMAILGWFALVAQFYLIIINRAASILETVLRYFSFYTILTNILIACCTTFLLLKPRVHQDHFFSRKATLAAFTLYITIVGLVYNLILRQIWEPRGLQLIVDELLHTIIPIAFLFFWLLFVSKNELKWKNILSWLIYPLIYIILILIRGKLSGFYPYPFIDVSKLGFSKVILNCSILMIVFLILSLLLIGIGKLMKKS